MKRGIPLVAALGLAAALGVAAYVAFRSEPQSEARGDSSQSEEASAEPLKLTDATFSSATASGIVLIDFWSLRCPPCRRQGPIVDRLAERFAGKVKVGKLDVDENGRTAQRFGIRAIPTLVILRDGQEAKRFVGLTDEETLAAALERALAAG